MALQNALTQPKTTFSAYLTNDAIKNRINQIVGSKDGPRFVTSLISAVSNNPVLADCDKPSILSAALLGDSLKLSPSAQLGQFYMVPYNDTRNGRKIAQFQIGYKGYIQLAMRSGQYRDLDVIEVREGEYKGKDRFTGKPCIEFIEDDNERSKLPIIGYFAYFELLNGFRKSLYWTKERMKEHALTYSKAYKTDVNKGWNNSFWTKDFDAMAFKTMLRQLISKWGIMSIEFQTAVEKDMAVLNDKLEPQYIDNAEPEQIQGMQQPAIEQKPEASPIIENQTAEQVSDPFSNFD